jgi:trans-aconitate 2-methyltransferase
VADWNADAYHRVSNPQFEWGLRVLDRLPLTGNELVVDVGCGTGRLTERVLERLPHGRVVGIDLSPAMLAVARQHLRPQFGARVDFIRADAAALPIHAAADAIFSTATLHWVRDHPALFRSLHDALRPGGRLAAQCGGGPNIDRLRRRVRTLMDGPGLAPYFATWREPWEFADAVTTEHRLAAAGFVEIATSVEPAFVVQPNSDAFREFVASVIVRPHLARLPDEALRASFVDTLTAEAAHDTPPFELDYWRLNISAVRPLAAA